MEVRLENSAQYIKTRTAAAHFIEGGDLALVGFTLDGRALYDGRLLSCNADDTRGRIVLLDTFSVKNEEELLLRVGEHGFGEVSLLRPGYADLSAACVGISVSGRLVYSGSRTVDAIEAAGYDGEAGFTELVDIVDKSDDPMCPLFARFAPAVREIYGERPLADPRPLYVSEAELPKLLYHGSAGDSRCIIGVTVSGEIVRDAQGYLPRRALQEKVPVDRAGGDGVLIVPSSSLYLMEAKVGGSSYTFRSFAATLDGRPVFDGSAVLADDGGAVLELKDFIEDAVLVFGPDGK